MAIFDIASGKIESYSAGWGGNGGSTVNLKRGQYYHSTTQRRRLDGGRHQDPAAPAEGTDLERRALARASISPTSKIYVATTAKERPLQWLHRGVRAGVNLRLRSLADVVMAGLVSGRIHVL